MNYIIRNIRAEYLKTHRTPIYWLLLLCPLALNIMVFLILNDEDTTFEGSLNQGGINPWMVLYNLSYFLFSGMFIILFVSIMTSMINNIEHKSNAWKHLYSLAQPRGAVYFNKSIYSLGLLMFTVLVFSLMQLLVGNMVGLTNPLLGYQNAPAVVSHNFLLFVKTFLATLGIWSIHHWLTFRYRNFALSVGIGILMLTFVTLAKDSLPWIKYLPYAFPGEIIEGEKALMNTTAVVLFSREVLLGIGWGVVIWLAGFWDAKKRDIA